MKYIFILLALVLGIAGCKEDIDTFIPDPLDPGLVTFRASAFVEVTDDIGDPVSDAFIRIGQTGVFTDQNGVVHLEDVTMSTATYLTVDKSGYFHGSRRFYPSPGRTHFVQVQLLPDHSVAGFESAAGAEIAVLGGVTLIFPPNAIVDDQGNPYTGTVDVSAQAIRADDPALSSRMPGDLVGRTVDGELSTLASLGMVAVELRSPAGEELRIAEGSQVTMQMDIPSSLSGSAPSSIPMWYFDEDEGVWIEEGSATREGMTYVGKVSHFTYWNYDAWFPITKWGATFVYANGEPAAQVSVCITILELETTKCASTNDDGIVCGMVASGELLLMEVVDACGNVVYADEIGPFSDTTFLDPITIPGTNVVLTEINGNAVNCSAGPVTDGFALVKIGTAKHYVDLDESSGAFSLTAINCNEEDVVITVIDEEALKESLPQTFPFSPVIDAGTIEVCEELSELIDLEVVGFEDHYLFFFPDVSTEGGETFIRANDSTSTGGAYFNLGFDGMAPGVYAGDPVEIGMQLPTGPYGYATDVEVTVTYYGDQGDFIQGTLTGTIIEGQGGPGSNEYPLQGTFSVLRE